MPLAACTEEGTITEQAAPSVSAPLPAPSAPPSSAAAQTARGASDKELCQSAKKAGDEMKAALVAALKAGKDPSPALFRKILTELTEKVTTVAATGVDGKVVTAMNQFGVEAAKAAAAADPAEAADNPAFEKAGKDLAAACKAAGVTVTF